MADVSTSVAIVTIEPSSHAIRVIDRFLRTPYAQVRPPLPHYIPATDRSLPMGSSDYHLNRLPGRRSRVTFELSSDECAGLATMLLPSVIC